MAKYKCKECDRVFERKQGLAVHRGVKHGGKLVKYETCEACMAVCTGAETLAEHMNREHLGWNKLELPVQPEGARHDMVNRPPHYTFGKYEVLDVLQDWFSQEPLLWQTVKYLARAGRKGPMMEDLRKAEFYLKRRIEQEGE